jgi:hypothetical protein
MSDSAQPNAHPALLIRWPRWAQMIGRQVRRAIRRRRYRAAATGAVSETQLQDLASAHAVRKAFFNAEAQMGLFR